MYCVVSRWKPKPGQEQEFLKRATQARAQMKKLPGIVFLEGFAPEGASGSTAVVCYQDKATYDKLVNQPGAPFEQIASQLGMEEVAEWVSSERGECLP